MVSAWPKMLTARLHEPQLIEVVVVPPAIRSCRVRLLQAAEGAGVCAQSVAVRTRFHPTRMVPREIAVNMC